MRKLLFSLSLVLVSCSLAHAVVSIDFGTGDAVTAGVMVRSGGNISGSGIPLDALGISGAPTNNGAYDTTGSVSHPSDPTDGTSAELSFNTDPGNNYIRVIGGIPGLGIGNGTTLLDGKFSSFSLTNPLPSLTVLSGLGPDVKSALLLTALGLPTDLSFHFFGFVISQNTGPDQSIAFSADLSNTAAPEPSSLLLLGTGLLGVIGLARRKRNQIAV